MMETKQVARHWSKVAEAYHKTQSPLHPCAQDIAIIERFVAQGVACLRASVTEQTSNANLLALLLGVTPDIATMAWPQGTNLLAIDSAERMLGSVWPGDVPGVRQAKLGDWLALPVADASCSIVIGDGSFNCLDFPMRFHQLAESVARALHDEGMLIVRIYVQPVQMPTPDELFQALMAGRFHTFDGFKFLLSMSLVDESYNIAVRDVWQQWVQAKLDQQAILGTTGWPVTWLETIAYYEHSNARYAFPTLSAAEQTLSTYFERIDRVFPAYPLGDCCPVLLLRKRSQKEIFRNEHWSGAQ